jgi:hypothetical protein
MNKSLETSDKQTTAQEPHFKKIANEPYQTKKRIHFSTKKAQCSFFVKAKLPTST